MKKLGNNEKSVKKFIDLTYSLYELFYKLGLYQDQINQMPSRFDNAVDATDPTKRGTDAAIVSFFNDKKVATYYRAHFYDMIYPMFFFTIRASLAEYRAKLEANEVEENVDMIQDLDEAEVLEDVPVQAITVESIPHKQIAVQKPEELEELEEIPAIEGDDQEELEELEAM
jgi:hypothetical protein